MLRSAVFSYRSIFTAESSVHNSTSQTARMRKDEAAESEQAIKQSEREKMGEDEGNWARGCRGRGCGANRILDDFRIASEMN